MRPTYSVDMSSLFTGLARASAAAKQAAAEGLSDAAEYVLSEANKHVPLEEGALQNSGRTEVDGLAAAIGYGFGPSAAYAVRQHEDTTLRHDPGRTSHWLSNALRDSRTTTLQLIADRIRRVTG